MIPQAVIEVTSHSTGQKYVSAKRNEYARMDFEMYVAVHRKAVKDEAKLCVIAESLEHFSGQAAGETVAAGMEDVVVRSCW